MELWQEAYKVGYSDYNVEENHRGSRVYGCKKKKTKTLL
jgi:hypothetical protein